MLRDVGQVSVSRMKDLVEAVESTAPIHDMFAAAPDLAYEQRVTVPLRAGDCTFHNGYLAHTANPNDTDEFRYAMVNIYVDAETRFNGAGHVCTDGLGLTVGEVLPDEEFPRF